VAEAAGAGAELIVTHHPLLFRPLERLTPDTPEGYLALALARAGIACAAVHTNLDAAPDGVSVSLAERLGLTSVRILAPSDGLLRKVVVFVPVDQARAVHAAMAQAGAGNVGDYASCAFETEGVGRFTPGPGTDPFIGKEGVEEAVAEVRLEVLVYRWDVPQVLAAMRSAHPYEEVAYDVYPLEQPATSAGFGAVGDLEAPEPLEAFLARVAGRLGCDALRYAGDPAMTIRRAAVCGGAGGDLIGRARAAGADAFVTADLTYHRFFDAATPAGHPVMALIDAGHYETEAHTEELIVVFLAGRFPGLEVRRTTARTSPVSTYIAA
jgi:dinuclear metal center YbgI/SA1388 family protein